MSDFLWKFFKTIINWINYDINKLLLKLNYLKKIIYSLIKILFKPKKKVSSDAWKSTKKIYNYKRGWCWEFADVEILPYFGKTAVASLLFEVRFLNLLCVLTITLPVLRTWHLWVKHGYKYPNTIQTQKIFYFFWLFLKLFLFKFFLSG